MYISETLTLTTVLCYQESHRAAYWGRYYLEFALMIYLCQLSIQLHFYNYADDTKCLNIINSLNDIDNLQTDLLNVSSWSLRWKLFFNETKFTHDHVRFCAANSDTTPTYTISGKVIDHITHHKGLGILFSSDLSWTEHYNHITPKAYKTLGLLCRTFKVITHKQKSCYTFL